MGTALVFGLCFACGEISARTGRLEICPDHPYYFCDGRRHVVLVGVSDRDLFHIWQNDKGFSWQKYLDDISRHHLNYVRQDVCCWGGLLSVREYPAQLSGAGWAFLRSGGGKAVDGKPRFDLTRFDESYFDKRIKPFLRAAAGRGIYVELTLFEEFRSTREFEQSLYAPANNINNLELKPRQITSDAALDNPALLSVQHAFIDKVLAETAAFGNIIYEISNEAGSARWVAHMIDYIHRHPTHPSRLVSAGEQASSFDPCKGANDIVIKHRGGGGLYATDRDVWNHHNALLRFRAGKPVSHNEYFLFANRSTDDPHFVRKMMWADFTAGGHSNFYDFSFWRGTGRTTDDGLPSRTPPAEILQGGKFLLDFLSDNDVHFWEMTPHDELACPKDSNGAFVMTLADPPSEYICYLLGAGPVTVTLKLGNDSFYARWYDPQSGAFIDSAQTVKGKDRYEFHSPVFEQDMVLYVHGSKARQ